MIRSFRCRHTERLYHGRFSPRLPAALQRPAARRLEMLDAASNLDSLRVPPANRLEKLRGDRTGR